MQNWDTPNLPENTRLIAAFSSYERAWEIEFSREHDSFKLPGQDNRRRYLPIHQLRIRIDPDDTPFEIFARVASALATDCEFVISTPPGFESRPFTRLREIAKEWATFSEETDDELASAIGAHHVGRVRYASSTRVPLAIRQAALEVPIFIADAPILMEGRLELLWYVREQSISFDYHRYGNLGARADEPRAIPV